MNGFIQNLGLMSDYLIVTGLAVLAFLIILSVIFKGSPEKSKSKLKTVFLFVLSINIILFLIFHRLAGEYFDSSLINSGILSFVFMIILTFLFSINIAMKIKNSIPKTKKGGNLEEISKEIVKANTISVIETSLLFQLPVVSMYFIGNGSLNGLLIYLLFSNFIVAINSLFFLPKAFRVFNNILD